MSQRLVLFSKFIMTMDRPQPIEDGFVMIHGSRILQVGKKKDLYFLPSVRMLDLGDTVLLPGLINAHCHLDFTALKGKVPYRGTFIDWLRRMGASSRKTTPAGFKHSIAAGIKESLSYGTTTLCDISTSWESWPLLRRSGLRAFVFLEIFDLIQSSPRAYWKKFTEKLQDQIRQNPPTATFRWGLSPHTPFTVSKELLHLVNRYLDSRGDVLTTIHMAESREETRLFKNASGPLAKSISALNPNWILPRNTTPVQYLNESGWLPKLDLGVHLNGVNDKDLNLLAKNRIAVVHCPGSHAFFGHPPLKYRKMRQRQIRVCLGTDSLASNQSLSLFREMRLFQKENPSVPAQEILSMVTYKPAEALGMGNELGRIKPGYLADLIGIPLSRRKKATGFDLFEQVLQYRNRISFAMVHGEPRFRLAQ
jgi:cytosine/adenosine deaminase-related metal-dependent hydrolase